MGTPSPGPGLTLLARTAATPRPVTSGYGDGPFFFFLYGVYFSCCLPGSRGVTAAKGSRCGRRDRSSLLCNNSNKTS